MNIYIYIYIHTYTNIHIYIHVYIYIYKGALPPTGARCDAVTRRACLRPCDSYRRPHVLAEGREGRGCAAVLAMVSGWRVSYLSKQPITTNRSDTHRSANTQSTGPASSGPRRTATEETGRVRKFGTGQPCYHPYSQWLRFRGQA